MIEEETKEEVIIEADVLVLLISDIRRRQAAIIPQRIKVNII
jgi:hypothetical protein